MLTLTSPQIKDNGTLAVKNACSDKQRSPNRVGDNISPPLEWSGVPAGTKSFALLLFDPEGRAPVGVSHMVLYGIPASVTGFKDPVLKPGMTREELGAALKDHVKGSAGLVTRFKHPT